jgi:dimeric dUTPase (all-alpha-NTP-PPase superfamily)
VVLFWQGFAVVAGDGCDAANVWGRQGFPSELADEFGRGLVVPTPVITRNRPTDVVQQGGAFQQASFAITVSMELAQLIEEAQRQTGHLLHMLRLDLMSVEEEGHFFRKWMGRRVHAVSPKGIRVWCRCRSRIVTGCWDAAFALPRRRSGLDSPQPMETPDQLRELFRMQKSLNARIGVHTDAMNEAEKTQWILNYCRAMSQELAELTDSVPWKWWAKYQKFDEQNARVEVVDCLHFLISMAQVLGMSADDVFAAYVKKNEVNLKRQDSGYQAKDADDSRHI